MPNVARSLPTLALALFAHSATAQTPIVRPPAVPLIAHNTYFSVWSETNDLADGVTRHWTGAEQPLTSLIRIDGKPYRLMGTAAVIPAALPQTGVKVWPTRTVYSFAGAGVGVELTFTTPSLPDDVDVLSRPASYVTWKVRSTDGKPHAAEVYFAADARLTVDEPTQNVEWSRAKVGRLSALSIGSEDQAVLQKKGDNVRIDWGHLLVAGSGRGYLGASAKAMEGFFKNGKLPGKDEPSKPRPAGSDVVAAFALPFGRVVSSPTERHLVVAYDEGYAVQFMGHNLRPYWRRNGMDGLGMVAAAARDYAYLTARCEDFDREMTSDLARAGGAAYADLSALAYRQSLAAQVVVADANGAPLMFSKENFSGGFIGTVDVLYPASPQLLLFSPTLLKASVVPLLEYALAGKWPWPYAPHDLGTYPKANGQAYGDGERGENGQMPVEETGNMLLMLGALSKIEGSADFAGKYWSQLERWAKYLADKGFDPERQLTTDDFAGHVAHNVNLSAKAIEGLGAYAMMAKMLGKAEEAAKYRAVAERFAARWQKEALDGDHYSLAFDKKGTWSQKYNLVWDRILGLDLFPQEVFDRETAYYTTKLNPYGLPLDSREDYTKLDWEIWTATMSERPEFFRTIAERIAKYLDVTPQRVPMSDWYFTSRPDQRGFQARSVVGGVFIKMLADDTMWRKYALKDKTKVGPWAPLPKPPVVTEVVPTAQKGATEWAYTFAAPPEGWAKPEFDASAWKKGPAGFGSGDDHGDAPIRTQWTSDEIWVRREFTLAQGDLDDVQLTIQHDDDAEVYVNGVLAVRLPGANRYETFDLPKSVRATLRAGKNVIAIHCRDTGGDQYLDAGFVTSRLMP